MPLNIEVIRGKKDLKIWDGTYWPLNCCYTAALKESAPNKPGILADPDRTIADMDEGSVIDFSWVPIYYLNIPECPLITNGEQTLLEYHEFHQGDGTVIAFQPGDVIRAWRSSK